MASAPPDPNALICPNCHAVNPPGSTRCGVCGASPLAPAGASGAPGYYPQPPAYPPQAPAYQPPPAPSYPAFAQAGAMRPPIVMDLPVDQALQRSIGALQAAGCQITGQTPPGAFGPGASIAFVKPFSDAMTTGGLTVKYNGALAISPEGEQRSDVSAQLTLDTGSVTPVYLITGAAGLVIIFFFSILFGAIALGAAIWFIWSRLNGAALNSQLDLIIARLGGGQSGVGGAPPGYGAPAPPYGAASPPPPGYNAPPPFTPGR